MGAEISIDFVSHYFPRQPQPCLRSLDLRIAAGESIALVGESGCGKSTLLQILAGLLLPTEGCVRINGRQVTGPNAQWNMMFQKPALYPWLDVRDNVALGLRFTGQRDRLDAKVAELLALVGLADKAGARVQDLSGGQQQRVALARSLAVNPQLILLDEPFSALDTFTRRNLQSEVMQIVKARGITLVLVTHDIDEAIAMGDRVVVMSRNPGELREVLPVPLPFPRNPMHPAFIRLREHLLDAFRASLRAAPAPVPGSVIDHRFANDKEKVRV